VNKLVLIDGNAILHRAFHALPPLTTRRGEPINAVYGLISMLLRVIQDLKPTHIAVVFDTPKPTFRNKLLSSYQAQRPETAKELIGQFEKARKVLKAFNIPHYEADGFEGDDVIGTLAEQAGKNEEVIIVTGDKDQLQLINDKKNIKLYMPITGLSNSKLMTETEVKEKMGIEAKLIDDYKALVGDPSDNYKGVPGIGPKTAINLLNEHGSLDNIYRNLKNISSLTAQKLKDGKKESEISKKLATIVKNVPIKLNLEECQKWDVDGEEVLTLFAEFGFKTLTERVKKVGKEIDLEKQGSLF
jgi:DNA polymerase-1